MSNSLSSRLGRTHYAWIVFATAAVTLLGAAGARSAANVLQVPLHEQYGWSRASIGVAVSINVLLFGFIGPFAAALQQRFGLRRVTVCALTLIGIGALGTTQMSELWHLYLLWGVIVGVGSGCMASVFASTVASRWFVRRRGLVTGVLTAATASGQLIFVPVLTRIADGPGWRWVGLAVGIGAFAVVPLVAMFLRNNPADKGLLPYGGSQDDVLAPSTGNPIVAAVAALNVARRTSTFWWLFASFGVCGLSTTGLVQTHFNSAAHDHGMSSSVAGGYLVFLGVFDVIGTIASGWLTDRWDPRKLLMIYYTFRGLSLFFLDPALATKGTGLFGFIAFYGLDWVATVPPTIALCMHAFGRQRGPLVYGWVFAGHQIGGALAAFGAGFIRDRTGSFQLAFTIAALACLAAAVGVMRIRWTPPPADPIAAGYVDDLVTIDR
jgi:predicted MFS family arabinose efflux permease